MCERCHKDIYRHSVCNYCKRKICINCVKSSRRVSKTIRLVICKDCWSRMPTRKAFKSASKE